MLNGFGTVVNALGKRVKPYLPQICGTILWRLNNKSAKVRQQAADLISRIAIVMKTCQEVRSIFLLFPPYSCRNPSGWIMQSGRPNASWLRQVESHLRDLCMTVQASASTMPRRKPI